MIQCESSGVELRVYQMTKEAENASSTYSQEIPFETSKRHGLVILITFYHWTRPLMDLSTENLIEIVGLGGPFSAEGPVKSLAHVLYPSSHALICTGNTLRLYGTPSLH